MRISILPIVLSILLFSCSQDNTESIVLKQQVLILQKQIDSLNAEIISLKQTNEKSSSKKRGIKKKSPTVSLNKEIPLELKQPDNKQVEKDSASYFYTTASSSSNSLVDSRQKPELSIQATQCIATTKAGNQCKRMVTGQTYCWQHKNYVAQQWTPTSTSNSSAGSSSGKTVYVKGYYRKDGTYVSPHTRSAPRRRN